MSNLLTLIKINLRETFDRRKFKQNKKQLSFLIYIGLLGLLLCGVSAFYTVIYGMNYVAYNIVDQLYTLSVSFFMVSTIVVFSSAISKMQSIFMGKDYDLLSAMPIRKRDIVLSKVLNLYFSEVLICLVVLIPNSLVCLIISQDVRFLALLPLILITPAFPMLVSLLITAILELIIKNSKVKNIINTVIMLSLVCGIMIVSMIFGSRSAEGGLATLFISLSENCIYANPSLYFFVLGFKENMAWILVYIGSNLLLLVLVLSIVTFAYTRIHNSMSTSELSSQKRKKGTISYAYVSPKKAIFNATAKQFFKSKASMVQCGVGIIMTIIFTVVVIIFVNQDITINIKNEDILLKDLVYNYAFMVPVLLSFFSGMVPPASTAVSLEGKNFFILKSTPLSFKDYLKSKLLFSVIFLSVTSFVASLIYVIFVPQSIVSIITTIVFPQLYAVCVSIFTLIINSIFPYFNWKEEIEVYKTHKSSMITTFADMGISITTGLITIILGIFFPIVACVALLVVYIGIDILLYNILVRKASRKLELLEVAD